MIKSDCITKKRAKDRDGLYKRRGYWHYELSVDGKKRSFSTRTKDYKEAKKLRAKAISALENGIRPNVLAKRKFAEITEKYISDRTPVVATGTLRMEKERMKPLVRLLGGKSLKEITSQTIRDYQTSRAKQVSTRTVNLETKLLRGILKSCGEWKRLAEDYTSLKESPANVGRALTPDEELRLFTTAESNPDWFVAYHAATIANHTGMRGVELRNLRMKDMDLDNRQVNIRRSKTESGLRIVVLTNEAMKAFLKLWDRAIALGASEPDHFLIPARDKVTRGFDPEHPTKGWRTAWRALTRNSGLRGFRFHDLRHSFISAHAEAGTPISVLQAQAGHLSKKMTEHYTHISERAMRKAQEKFEEVKRALQTEAMERVKEQASTTSVN